MKLQFILILRLAQARPMEPCLSMCGDVPIRFPFGIGEGCYIDNSFEVTCNNSFVPPKPFLTSINMELLVVLPPNQVQVNNPKIYSNCSNKPSTGTGVSLINTPFIFSNASNRFTATGCDNYTMLEGKVGDTVGGCLSICQDGGNSSGCYGINCCQTTIPSYMQFFEANMINPFSNNRNSCKSAFMVDQDWFASQSSSSRSLDDLNRMDHVPAVLDWANDQGYCDPSKLYNGSVSFCTTDGSYCWHLITTQVCICECKDANCIFNFNYDCRLFCMDIAGGYNCSCPPGHTKYDGSNRCYPNSLFGEKSQTKTKNIIIGVGSSLGFLLFLIIIWSLYKIIKRRKAMKLKQKNFKRNGGLLLEQQLSSTENHVEQTKVFTSKELEKATDNYNINRILGQGGQGTVYKGMLIDGKVVAIKKSKAVDEDKLDQFINEVVILSGINHRNVVKLIGCCLETEVPMLVYEFIPNGALFQYIRNPNEEFPVTWEMRLRIATEVAGALAYLHSAASIPIYHRDIKSSNILLDEKYRAKVADFGYLDPEYLQSSQFTEKSDVYSFGVVLVELLTGQKPISSSRSAEERSLATYFLLSMEENRLFEILDARVLKEGGKEEIIGVARLAKRCLDLNGKKRPTMKTLAMELEGIRSSQGASFTNGQDYEEVDYRAGDFTELWDEASDSTGSLNSLPIRLDVQVLPLL